MQGVLEDGELGAARTVGQHDAGRGVRGRSGLREPPRHRAERSAQIDGDVRAARRAESGLARGSGGAQQGVTAAVRDPDPSPYAGAASTGLFFVITPISHQSNGGPGLLSIEPYYD
ncbi:hypothetical protein Mro03_45210 [Microbispora rosea subsp. rosea]|nr:hypothetical protein Mro03_45210 [Microbispora rosea subsp. rosea]